MIVVQALLTALLSGVFWGVIQFELNEGRDRAERLLEKTEAAYDAYSAWSDAIVRYLWHYAKPVAGDDVLEHDRRADELYREVETLAIETARLLLIYLPRLDHHLTEVHVAQKPAFERIGQIRVRRVHGGQLAADDIHALREISVSVIEATKLGKRAILESAVRVAHRPRLLQHFRFTKRTPR